MQNFESNEQAHEHADNLQSEIDDLHMKAQSSSGEEKQGYMQKIQDLSQKKDAVLQKMQSFKTEGKSAADKAKEYFGKLGM